MELDENEMAALVRSNTEKVFSTMLSLPIQARPADEDPLLLAPTGGIIALVGFAGQWSGSGTIRCSADLARNISGKLLMTEFDQINEEVLDAMGEIANMIVGNFKDSAASILGILGLSTPTVIYGTNFKTRNWHGQRLINVPFDCENEIFEVKICLAPSVSLQDLKIPPSVTLGP
jgi:chemotaxis protein CheX